MKKIIKLSIILIVGIIINITGVRAINYDDSFYPGHFISDEYIRKEKNGQVENKQSRFIFRKSDGMFAYCIEPFKVMKENEIYKAYTDTSLDKTNLTEELWQKVRLISYYGYGYGNHKEDKWFTITQMMIWKVIDPKAKFNWTDTLGGKVINKYEKEMEEINQLVANHNKLPNYANKNFKTSINKTIQITDENFDISDFKITTNKNLNITKQNNTIAIDSEAIGHYELNFVKEDTRFKNIPIIYIDNVAQNIVVIGNNDIISFNLYIDIESGTLKINKLDKDTNSIISNSAASIIGTTFSLYNDKKELITELIVNAKGQIIYENLSYGNYCVKETKSGEGYVLDEQEHCFTIDEKNLNIDLNLYNEVIKEEIIIEKYLETKDGQKEKKEPNIKFNITGLTHSYKNSVTTNNNGSIKITLPYGKYLFEQVNTTPGYLKVDDFIVNVDGQNKQHKYELIDQKEYYEVEVPNTGINKIDIKKGFFIISILSYAGLLIIEKFTKNKNYSS